jgi:hypothetical protein
MQLWNALEAVFRRARMDQGADNPHPMLALEEYDWLDEQAPIKHVVQHMHLCGVICACDGIFHNDARNRHIPELSC